MAEIKRFIVVSESVRFMSNGITVRRGEQIEKGHPCFDLILPYPDSYENKNPARNRFKAVRCDKCQGDECKGCKPEEEAPEKTPEKQPEVKEETPKTEVKEEQPKQKKTAPAKGK